jgi:hypothetical protein
MAESVNNGYMDRNRSNFGFLSAPSRNTEPLALAEPASSTSASARLSYGRVYKTEGSDEMQMEDNDIAGIDVQASSGKEINAFEELSQIREDEEYDFNENSENMENQRTPGTDNKRLSLGDQSFGKVYGSITPGSNEKLVEEENIYMDRLREALKETKVPEGGNQNGKNAAPPVENNMSQFINISAEVMKKQKTPEWLALLRARVVQKLKDGKKENQDIDVLLKKEEELMYQELQVARRVSQLNKQKAKPIFPNDFHAQLATHSVKAKSPQKSQQR